MANDMAKGLLDDACKALERAIDAQRVQKTVVVKKGATLYSVRRITIKA